MKHHAQKSAATLALAALVAGTVGVKDAKAAHVLGTGAEIRSTLLRTAHATETNASSPTPSPTPDSKGGEGKCGEGKCGGGKK